MSELLLVDADLKIRLRQSAHPQTNSEIVKGGYYIILHTTMATASVTAIESTRVHSSLGNGYFDRVTLKVFL